MYIFIVIYFLMIASIFISILNNEIVFWGRKAKYYFKEDTENKDNIRDTYKSKITNNNFPEIVLNTSNNLNNNIYNKNNSLIYNTINELKSNFHLEGSNCNKLEDCITNKDYYNYVREKERKLYTNNKFKN